jgi:hypothetical protein
MERLLPLFAQGGARVVFSGHEHNFQHSRHNGIDYLVTGAGSKVQKEMPNAFVRAHTVTWSNHAHFLLVTIDGDQMQVRPFGELVNGELAEIPRFLPSGEKVAGPIMIGRQSRPSHEG